MTISVIGPSTTSADCASPMTSPIDLPYRSSYALHQSSAMTRHGSTTAADKQCCWHDFWAWVPQVSRWYLERQGHRTVETGPASFYSAKELRATH